MSVVDLHPEDLLDKVARAELSEIEKGRLDAHVATCAACRFELSARLDFAELALELPMPLLVGPERTKQALAPAPELLSQPKRARRPVWVLAVAALLTTGASLGAWLSQRTFLNEPAAPVPSAAPAISTRASGRPRAHSRTEPRAPLASSATAIRLEALPLGDPSVEHTQRALTESRAAEAKPVARATPGTSRVAGSRPHEASAPRLDHGVGSSGDGKPSSEPIAERNEAAQEQGPADLFHAANQARREGDASRAIELYRGLQSRFPGSDEARLSRATLAQLMLDRGDATSALEGFDQYLSQGGALLGEEALVGRALSLSKLGDRDREITAWREVLRRFPGSVHARLARSRLGALGER